MPQDNNARRVEILLSVANFIYTQARALYIAGTGEDIAGNEVTNAVSEIDTLPPEMDGTRWANAAARFIQYLATVLQLALQEEYEQNAARILTDLSNVFEDDTDQEI